MDSGSGNDQVSELKVVFKDEPEDNIMAKEQRQHHLQQQQQPHPLQQQQHHVLRSEQENGGSGKSTAVATGGSGEDQECEQSYKDEHDNSSRKNTGEGASGDDLEYEHASKRRRRHRHTPEQVQQLESVFKYCALPDKKLRQELSDALGLNELQVKFWFQNRRIQMKALQERSDNAQLRSEIERMKAENVTIREAIKHHMPACTTCTEPASVQQQAIDELQRRRAESTRLREELEQVMSKSFGRPAPMYSNGPHLAPPLAGAVPDSLSLELAVGRHPASQEIMREQQQQMAGGLISLEVGKNMEDGSGNVQRLERQQTLKDKPEMNLAGDDQGPGQQVQKGELENGFGKNSEGVSGEDQESEHASQDEHEDGSGKNMEETGSGDDQEYEEAWKKKRYQRHTAEQIHQLELFFKRCAHPDQKQREQLSIALGLNLRQVKFWFQNRRNQMKTLQERYDNTQLRAEIDRLRAENVTIREAIKHHLVSCSESASGQQEAIDDHKRRAESTLLREELEHVTAASFGRPASSPSCPPLAAVFPDSLSLELAVGRRPTLQEPTENGRGEKPQQRQSQGPPTLLEVALSWPGGISGTEKAAVVDLAESAFQEILQMVQAEEPLWSKRVLGDQTVLRMDCDVYMKRFPGRIGMRTPGLVTEATRDTGLVSMNSLVLLDALMDANKWTVMFPSIIAKALTIKVLSPGTAATLDGALQLMYVELQALSPLLQTREIYFLRYCKRAADKLWVLVDVSMDCLRDNPPPCLLQCRRRPSGCIVQDMPNGHSQVTWLEHVEVDHRGSNHIFLPFLSGGSAFGAKRWVCALQRYCEDIGSLLATNMTPTRDLGVVNTLEGRRSTLRLAKKMINRYCSNVSATSSGYWVGLPNNSANIPDDVRFMTRDNSGDGIILCAATSTWLPFSHQRVFEFLRSEEYRAQRNVLANGSAQEMSRIAKGQHPGNNVSLLRVNGPSQSNILILQESWTDESGSLLVYMPVDFSTITRVLQGEDPSDFLLLPSGFAILPDGPLENRPTSLLLNGDGASAAGGSTTGIRKPSASSGSSLLTVSFQTVVSHMPSSGKLNTVSVNPVSNILFNTMESMNTVSKIIFNTLQHIKIALESSKT